MTVTRIALAPTGESTAAARERAVLIAFAVAALALGAFAVVGSAQWLALAMLALTILIVALLLPLPWLGLLLAGLLPFQFYFEIPGTAITLRVAVLLVFAAALRVLIERVVRKDLTRWHAWMAPAALFLIVALVAAFGAASRYLALKGIYDWLIIFAAAFVVGAAVRAPQTSDRLVRVLIAGGVVQAALGLFESAVGLDAILAILRLPVSTLFFQPNLLQERLADTSFNWVVFDRAAPFGTFINGIDYAIYLAAILGLALALLLAERGATPRADAAKQTWRRVNRTTVLFGGVLLMSAALLLTFKGSGLIAIAGAAVIVGLFSLRRLSPRMLALGLIALLCAILLALPFTDLIAQRAAFLVQREQGATGTAGRLEIWASLLQDFAQRPLFGYGLNAAAVLTEPTRTLNRGAFAFNFPSAESGYVAALVETGIAGFAALMALFAATLARAVRAARANALGLGALAALVALGLGNLTVAGFTTDQNGMLLGMLIGIVFAAPRVARA